MRLTLRLSPSLMTSDELPLEIQLKGKQIYDCISEISKQSPEIHNMLWKDGHVNPQILMFHNNTLIRESDFNNSVRTGDVLDIIPAIEGG